MNCDGGISCRYDERARAAHHPVEETIATDASASARPSAHVARASKFSVIGLLGGRGPPAAAAPAAL